MIILFSGGGTLGPVTPLLAVKEIISDVYPQARFIWVGTKGGPEKKLLEKEKMVFYEIASGKLRRYVSILNLFDMVKMLFGFFQSMRILLKEKPDLCVSAGGFVSVPVHVAAWLFRVPTWIHQQDIMPGLANIFMAPCAKKITTVTEISKKYFFAQKAILLGNPLRKNIFLGNTAKGLKKFHLSGKKPIVFITGGGTGSARINTLVIEALPYLAQLVEIVHLFGEDRDQVEIHQAKAQYTFYHPHAFLTEKMNDAYAMADVVISRGGFGAITELAALKKATIFIPKPGHQEQNVEYIHSRHAGIILNEKNIDGKLLAETIKRIITDKESLKKIGMALHDSVPIAKKEDVIRLVSELLNKTNQT